MIIDSEIRMVRNLEMTVSLLILGLIEVQSTNISDEPFALLLPAETGWICSVMHGRELH